MDALDGFLIGWLDCIALNWEHGQTTVNCPDNVQRMLVRRGWMKYTGPADFDGARTMVMTPLGERLAKSFTSEHRVYSEADE